MIRITFALIFSAFMFCWTAWVWAGTWRDDFEDGNLDGWEQVKKGFGKWKVLDGACNGEFIGEGQGRSFLVMGKPNWKDYTVECKMKVINLSGGDGSGIIIRFKDQDNYYFFELSIAWTRISGGFANQAKENRARRVPMDKWLNLKITAIGNQFKFIIDGEELFTFDDPAMPTGRIGFYVNSSSTLFDDFSVSGADVPDGGPAVKSVDAKSKVALTWGRLKLNN